MTKTQIIGAIMLATGKQVSQVAKEHGYTKATFYRVINNELYSQNVRDIIAVLISKPVSEIWPENTEQRETAPVNISQGMETMSE